MENDSEAIDPVAEYLAAPLGKFPPPTNPCPSLTPCRCGLLVPAPPCNECASPAVRYLTGGRDVAVSLSAGRRNERTTLMILGVLVLAAALVVANSLSGVQRPGDPPRTMEAQ